ncbi:MAG: hypothetical protein N3A66_02505, partial [Planctomycetota bacterium]|nr:hypothetical protein [Planctomycetota bacterium]
ASKPRKATLTGQELAVGLFADPRRIATPAALAAALAERSFKIKSQALVRLTAARQAAEKISRSASAKNI